MSTQGLNVIQNKMGTGTGFTTYRLIDIGGGVVVLVNTTSGTNYLNFKQTDDIYDLKFSDANESRMDDVKWCMEPGNNMGLTVSLRTMVVTDITTLHCICRTMYCCLLTLIPRHIMHISPTWNTVA